MKRLGILITAIMIMGTSAMAIDRFESKKDRKAREAQTKMLTAQAEQNGIKLIGLEKAKETALKAAGADESKIKYYKIKLDREDDYNPAIYVYEIEFLHDGLEYEFEINGENNEILKTDVE